MPTPNKPRRPSIDEYLSALKNSPKYGPQLVCHRNIPKATSRYYEGNAPINAQLTSGLKRLGINKLYSHQGDAIEKIGRGKNVMVSTPTSSGKSMVYNLPVFENILACKKAHAFYIFPLKALSQDQFKNIMQFAAALQMDTGTAPGAVAAIYDGDTTPYMRRKIRDHPPNIIITNPEMIHLSFLPFHESWAGFFRYLKYIIIDEVHTYRGVFGSHVAWLIRRLKRIIEYYGNAPRFILSSATIGNPHQFSESLTEESFEVITETGAPQSKKHFLFLNPWDSPAYTASQLLEAALKRGLRTIVYTQSRKMTELISLWTRPNLGDLSDKLSSYRAGFLPEERREIEAKLNDGTLLGVISTSALELGIDIGDLDLCLLVGYPGSIMASWQRGGRVGRSGSDSAVILIGGEDALDQYYMNNPERFFTQKVESAVLNPANEKILKEHLVCAAAEIPLADDEKILQNTSSRRGLAELLHKSMLLQSANGSEYYASRKRPQRNVNLRGSGNTLSIISGDTGVILGEVDASRALKECHEGAVYLHRVNTYMVTKLDLHAQEVVVVPQKPSFYTKPMSTKDTEILKISHQRMIYGCNLCFGQLKVTEKVTGYQKRNSGTNKLITTIPLDLPEQTLETEGFWLEIPSQMVSFFEEEKMHFMGGLHAFEHLLISVFPLLILCDRNDVGGISCPHHEQTSGATVFIYDGHPGGSGLSAEAFDKAEKLVERAQEIVSQCDCENGCPSCVHSPKCGSGNRPIDKLSCLTLIQKVLSQNLSKGSKKKEPAIDQLHTAQVKAMNQYLLTVITEDKSAVSLPQHYGVFDLETKYSADEVGGWHRAEKMGISLGVVYDSKLDGCVTYFENEVDKLIEHLVSLDLIVGFNNKRFDNRVLSPYTDIHLAELPTIDLLEEVVKHLGYRLSLNSLAEHTLGVEKAADGLQALQWYRSGEFAKLVKYCKKDVEITKDLFVYGFENGFLIFQNKAKKKVRLPLSLDQAILSQLRKNP